MPRRAEGAARIGHLVRVRVRVRVRVGVRVRVWVRVRVNLMEVATRIEQTARLVGGETTHRAVEAVTCLGLGFGLRLMFD